MADRTEIVFKRGDDTKLSIVVQGDPQTAQKRLDEGGGWALFRKAGGDKSEVRVVVESVAYVGQPEGPRSMGAGKRHHPERDEPGR